MRAVRSRPRSLRARASPPSVRSPAAGEHFPPDLSRLLSGADGAAAGDGAGASGDAAAAAGSWETIVTKHPDGTEIKLYKHSVTGEIRWG